MQGKEVVFRDARGQLGRERSGHRRFGDDDGAAGLLHAGHDGVDIQRVQPAQVEHLAADAVLRSFRRGVLHRADAGSVRQDRHVGSLANDPRPATIAVRDGKVDLFADPVTALRLEEDDRVGILDRVDK